MIQAASKEQNSVQIQEIQQFSKIAFHDHLWEAGTLSKFIDFWKLEIENNLLHVFSFFHKFSFKNNFCCLFILGCQISFLVLKIENCFWK